MPLTDWIQHAFAQGWVCVRTKPDGSGHVALDTHARSASRPSLDACLAWAREDGNVEVLLHESGLLQVDAEAGAAAPWSDPAAHDGACLSRSPGGGLHAVYACPADLAQRRWIRPVLLVDLLARGSWPLPGCRRTGGKVSGEWAELAPPIAPGPPPDWVLAAVPRPPPPTPPAGPPQGRTRRAAAAMAAELAEAENAPPGTSHARLHKAACALGSLIGAGELEEDEVRAGLEAAAHRRQPHQAREALKAIDDGLTWGKAHPRAPAGQRPAPAAPVPDHEPGEHGEPAPSADVLVPGAWHVGDVSPYAFAHEALARMPLGSVYRRGGLPGELVGQAGTRRFVVLTPGRMRMLASRHVRFIRYEYPKDGEPVAVFVPLSRDHAAQIVDRAVDHPSVRELDWVASHPFCVGEDFERAQRGYNESGRCFFDPPPGLSLPRVESAEEVRAVLDDLVVDFPFADQASRENFYGLMLTPLMRPAIAGSVPMHVITSPIERTGKTTLARDVLGIVVLGHQTPALQLTGSEDEQDKRITAKLLSGATLVMFDNLSDEVVSPALASLLTATHYEGRRLGLSEMISLPNRMTVVATGNNLRAASEIAKRSVPIVLASSQENPEDRRDFQHERIAEYALERRERVLGALFSAVDMWRAAGARAADASIGGFETWRDAVGGVLAAVGFRAWLANRRVWAGQADDFAADLAALVRAWWSALGETPAAAKDLLAVADMLEVFGHVSPREREPRSRATTFGMRVLRRADGRVVTAGPGVLVRVERLSSGSSSLYRLRHAAGPSGPYRDLFSEGPGQLTT